MPGKCRPSLRAKTLENVMRSNLSVTDKECIKAVFDLNDVLRRREAEPVRHGRWVHAKTYYDLDECNCSLCGQLMTTEIGKRMNYCPNCVAKMDGDSNG